MAPHKVAMENDTSQIKRRAFSHERSITGKDEWLTPPYIVKALGNFDLDPCSPVNRPWPTARHHLTQLDDGLVHTWDGRVWCNPPYGPETRKWLSKLVDHANGIALVCARTETKWFHQHVWTKAHSVFFFKGRLSFHHVDGTQGDCAGAPSCLIAYGEQNMLAISDAHAKGMIQGFHVVLKSIDR